MSAWRGSVSRGRYQLVAADLLAEHGWPQLHLPACPDRAAQMLRAAMPDDLRHELACRQAEWAIGGLRSLSARPRLVEVVEAKRRWCLGGLSDPAVDAEELAAHRLVRALADSTDRVIGLCVASAVNRDAGYAVEWSARYRLNWLPRRRRRQAHAHLLRLTVETMLELPLQG